HALIFDMQHVYIKPRTPQHNGKVERSHLTDQTEFYQLLSYTDDVDLYAKLEAWENFYNYDRPHMSHQGKTPYEMMRSILK
ncbi:MAG: integrase core domain-containing protein, partial [Bacteroidota bacterium]